MLGIPLSELTGGFPEVDTKDASTLFDWVSEVQWNNEDGKPELYRVRPEKLKHLDHWKICAMQHASFIQLRVYDIFSNDNLFDSIRYFDSGDDYYCREAKIVKELSLMQADVWRYRVWYKILNGSYHLVATALEGLIITCIG